MSSLPALAISISTRVGPTSYGMFGEAAHAGRGRNATFHSLNDPSAVCLDGSRYGYFWCPGKNGTTAWKISLQGGGWCYDEEGCAERSRTRLGSSLSWSTCRGGGIPSSPLICPACNPFHTS